MCRLALFNKKGEELIQQEYGLAQYLLYLENSCGGHGNGLSLMKDGKVVYLKKGVKYNCYSIAKKMQSTEYDWAVFHTRIKSVGKIEDRNCHPFKVGKTVLAMNGTESSFSTLADLMDITDTETVLRVTKKMKLPLLSTLVHLSSVYIGFEEGLPFVTCGKSWGDLEVIKNHEGAIVFGSEFPAKIKSYKPKTYPFFWFEGVELKNLEKVNPYTKHLKFAKYFNYDDYDSYYGSSYSSYGSSNNKASTKEVTTGTVKSPVNTAINTGNTYLSKDRGDIEHINIKEVK